MNINIFIWITSHLASLYNEALGQLGTDLLSRGGGLLGLIFAGYVPLASQSPYPIIVYSVANYRPHLSHFWQICNFRDLNLVTSFLYELTHFLHWMKNNLIFICDTKILVRLLTVNMKNRLT